MHKAHKIADATHLRHVRYQPSAAASTHYTHGGFITTVSFRLWTISMYLLPVLYLPVLGQQNFKRVKPITINRQQSMLRYLTLACVFAAVEVAT